MDSVYDCDYENSNKPICVVAILTILERELHFHGKLSELLEKVLLHSRWGFGQITIKTKMLSRLQLNMKTVIINKKTFVSINQKKI